ncbi:39S ribosomal protein L23, mitochondrial isoform X4 [Cricetulus griseus]|uniref:Large ribosomal subunit protein uL23m n=1 Tax=Cricetulus griseus TaxID=10029 RepID=A0A9J7FP88_CRIGR|nr:39S ribosomal protein L23, mitochondrial isoform X4 [Cricetulus griseus]XP_027297819.1 39S ribosomal protein L23, mitochondrial isoform X4 [Cricetulus griseus]
METGFGEPCTQLGRGLQELPAGWEVYKTTRQRFCFVYRPDNGTPSTSWVVPSSVCSEPTSSSSWCGLVLPSLKILCNSESLWSKMTRVDLRNYLEQIYNVPVAAVRTRVQHDDILCLTGKWFLDCKTDQRPGSQAGSAVPSQAPTGGGTTRV